MLSSKLLGLILAVCPIALAVTGPAVVYSGLTPLAGTLYFPVAGGALPSGTENAAATFVASPGAVSNFYVNIFPAPGAGATVQFTWRKGGVSQPLTCTITGPSTNCSDTVHTFMTSAGELLDIQTIATGTVFGIPRLVMSAQFAPVPTVQDIQQSAVTLCYDTNGAHTVSFSCSRNPAGAPMNTGSTILFRFASSTNGADACVDVEGSGCAGIVYANGAAIPAGTLAGDGSGVENTYLLTFEADDDLWVMANQLLPGPGTFASLFACNAGMEGFTRPVTDSNTAIWGANVAGGGTNHILAYCDGSAWKVMAK